MSKNDHPYHYTNPKSLSQRLLDFGVPIVLFFIYFQFYNFGKITPSEMVKTSGLLAIALLSLSLVIGPLCRFFPTLDVLKAHRKVWGIASFFAAVVHMGLIFYYFLKLDVTKLFDTSNPKFLGLSAGLLALLILLVVTLSSIKQVLHSLDPKVWKFIQTTSYLALILAVTHFYLVESKDGILVIKRLLGQLTFGFAFFAILLKLFVTLIPKKK